LAVLRARCAEDLLARTVVLRFLDIAAVPARSPVSGLTFSLSVCSFDTGELESLLSEPDNERVVMPFEVGCLALTTSSAGTSWKTVKVLEAMRAAKQMVCLQKYPIQIKP